MLTDEMWNGVLVLMQLQGGDRQRWAHAQWDALSRRRSSMRTEVSREAHSAIEQWRRTWTSPRAPDADCSPASRSRMRRDLVPRAPETDLPLPKISRARLRTVAALADSARLAARRFPD